MSNNNFRWHQYWVTSWPYLEKNIMKYSEWADCKFYFRDWTMLIGSCIYSYNWKLTIATDGCNRTVVKTYLLLIFQALINWQDIVFISLNWNAKGRRKSLMQHFQVEKVSLLQSAAKKRILLQSFYNLLSVKIYFFTSLTILGL